MRPFDLDAAKSGEKVCLRDGTPVRIICFDRKHDIFKLIVLVSTRLDDYEILKEYKENGLYGNSEGSTFDLMMVNDEKQC